MADNNSTGTSLFDIFRERLLNPFIFSLVLAFIARYRVELYDLFISSAADSKTTLESLTLWDKQLFYTLIVMIGVYLISIALGNLVFFLKETINSFSNSKLKKIVPVSKEEYDLVVDQNNYLKKELKIQKAELLNSAEHFSKLLIKAIKGTSVLVNQLELIMPHEREPGLGFFVYSIKDKTRVIYGLFNSENSSDLDICLPILQSEIGQLICVKFKIKGTNFVYQAVGGVMTTPRIEVPTNIIHAQSWQSWVQQHYYDESSNTWTTVLPSRQRSFAVRLNENRESLFIGIVENPNYKKEQALKNLLGVKY